MTSTSILVSALRSLRPSLSALLWLWLSATARSASLVTLRRAGRETSGSASARASRRRPMPKLSGDDEPARWSALPPYADVLALMATLGDVDPEMPESPALSRCVRYAGSHPVVGEASAELAPTVSSASGWEALRTGPDCGRIGGVAVPAARGLAMVVPARARRRWTPTPMLDSNGEGFSGERGELGPESREGEGERGAEGDRGRVVVLRRGAEWEEVDGDVDDGDDSAGPAAADAVPGFDDDDTRGGGEEDDLGLSASAHGSSSPVSSGELMGGAHG